MLDNINLKVLNFPHGPKQIFTIETFTYTFYLLIISNLIAGGLVELFSIDPNKASESSHNTTNARGKGHFVNFISKIVHGSKSREDDVEPFSNRKNICKLWEENGTTKTGIIFDSIWTGLMVGFEEELIFRFLIYRILLLNQFGFKNYENGNLIAIVISSLLFGLVHYSNMVTAGYSVNVASLQVTNAFIGGLLFAGVYSITGNLFIPILTHFVYDGILMTLNNVQYYDDNC